MDQKRYKRFLESVIYSLIAERRKDGKSDLDDVPYYDAGHSTPLTIVPYNVMELMAEQNKYNRKPSHFRTAGIR